MLTPRRAALSLTALLLPLALTAATPASAATTPGGSFADANGIIVDLVALTALPIPGPLAGTPIDPNTFSTASQSCPPGASAADTDSLLNVPADPAATADVVSTMAGATCATGKEAAVASAVTTNLEALSVSGPVPLITATVIRAQANSSCTKAPDADGSQFVGLSVAGTPVPANVPANTRIDIPGVASVIINEQHPSASGRGIVVNGLHIIGASPLLRGDLIISHAVSGVACSNGAGSTNGATPTIVFTKDATPSTAKPGTLVTYTSTVKNTTTADCDVLKYVDHVNPVFELVSSKGDFGTALDSPAPKRADGGVDAVLRPAALTIAAGATKTQTFVVKVKAGTKPGTYFNNLELFCAVNGDFASGPLAPVTVPAPPAPLPPQVVTELPHTGLPVVPAVLGLGMVLTGAAAIRRRVVG